MSDKARKIKARSAVMVAIETGLLVRPSVCVDCQQSGNIEAHHPSYEESEWLNVIWLCRICHFKRHPKKERKPKTGGKATCRYCKVVWEHDCVEKHQAMTALRTRRSPEVIAAVMAKAREARRLKNSS